MIEEAKEYMENRQFQREMRDKKGLARTASATTELNKSKRKKQDKLIPSIKTDNVEVVSSNDMKPHFDAPN